MSENTEKKTTLEDTIDGLAPALESFAVKYQPVKDADGLNDVQKKALANRRKWAEETLSIKSFYTDKSAEELANRHDLTFRAERRVASGALNGERWERVLIPKSADLWMLLKNRVSKLRTIATIVREPDDVVAPYAGYFAMKVRAGVKSTESALHKYSGKAMYRTLNTVRGEVSKAHKMLQTIIETGGGDVPDPVLYWARDNAQAEKKEAVETAA